MTPSSRAAWSRRVSGSWRERDGAMRDESPVCRVASRVLVAAWSEDPAGPRDSRDSLTRSRTRDTGDGQVRLELHRFEGARGTYDPCGDTLPASILGAGAGTLP